MIPDSIEPVVAWRLWNWDQKDYLYPWNNQQIYLPNQVYKAECSSTRRAPHPPDNSERCHCGIYGVKGAENILDTVYTITRDHRFFSKDFMFNQTAPYKGRINVHVMGCINLWGHIVEHEWGYRAEFGYPKALFVNSVIPKRKLTPLYEYGVPVIRMDDYYDFLVKASKEEEWKLESPKRNTLLSRLRFLG